MLGFLDSDDPVWLRDALELKERLPCAGTRGLGAAPIYAAPGFKPQEETIDKDQDNQS